MGLVMTGPRVWLPAPGVVLVHRAEGFPMPPLDHGARAAIDPPVSNWPWERDDVWPCTGVEAATDDEPSRPWWICRRLAVWRVSDGSTRGHYCPAHVPTKPHRGSVPLCAVCTGPMDPWLIAHGYSAHHNCDPTHTCDSTEETMTA